MDTSSKAPWLSKTLWANAILAAVAFFPGAQAYLNAHPLLVTEALVGINFVLRFVTKDKIALS